MLTTEYGRNAQRENRKVLIGSQQLLVPVSLWSSCFSCASRFHVRLDICHVLVWYVPCPGCVRFTTQVPAWHNFWTYKGRFQGTFRNFPMLEKQSLEPWIQSFARQGSYHWTSFSRVRVCWKPSPEHVWAELPGRMGPPDLAVALTAAKLWRCSLLTNPSKISGAKPATCLVSPLLMLARSQPSPPPAAWPHKAHAHVQGGHGGPLKRRIPASPITHKFLWIYLRLQITAGWGPLSRPSPSRCSCGFYWHKEAPKVELRSSLAVESPIPPDATIRDQSLVYVVRSCWERAGPGPVHQQVSHTWLFPADWEDREPETWVTTSSHMEETRRGPKFSAARLPGLHLLHQKQCGACCSAPCACRVAKCCPMGSCLVGCPIAGASWWHWDKAMPCQWPCDPFQPSRVAPGHTGGRRGN